MASYCIFYEQTAFFRQKTRFSVTEKKETAHVKPAFSIKSIAQVWEVKDVSNNICSDGKHWFLILSVA